MRHDARTGSRGRLLAAAAEIFAAKGFDGAKVDRIARTAGVNKAMIYYHFGSKLGLYRQVLRAVYSQAGEQVQSVARSDASPEAKLEAFTTTLASTAVRHPHIPPIMLRELLERGVHLDAATLRLLRALPETLGAIVRDGCTRGVFRDVNPFMIYITILSPIVFFLASRPVRQRLSRMGTGEVASVPLDGLIAYVQQLALAGLRTDPGDTSRQPRRRG